MNTAGETTLTYSAFSLSIHLQAQQERCSSLRVNDGLLEMILSDQQTISMLNKIVMKGTTVLWLYLLWKRRNGMEMPCL